MITDTAAREASVLLRVIVAPQRIVGNGMCSSGEGHGIILQTLGHIDCCFARDGSRAIPRLVTHVPHLPLEIRHSQVTILPSRSGDAPFLPPRATLPFTDATGMLNGT